MLLKKKNVFQWPLGLSPQRPPASHASSIGLSVLIIYYQCSAEESHKTISFHHLSTYFKTRCFIKQGVTITGNRGLHSGIRALVPPLPCLIVSDQTLSFVPTIFLMKIKLHFRLWWRLNGIMRSTCYKIGTYWMWVPHKRLLEKLSMIQTSVFQFGHTNQRENLQKNMGHKY